MKVGEIVGEALDYPGTNLKKVVTLGALIILSGFILPMFLVYGYWLRVLKATIAGFDELPDFDEWGGMFIDGLKVLVIGIVYMIIPMIFLVAGILSISINPTDPTFGIISIVIGVILAIIFALVEQIAIAHMAFNDRLGAAFQIGEILNVISEITWTKYIIWIIGVAIIQSGTMNVTLAILGFIFLPIISAFGALSLTQMNLGAGLAIFVIGFIIAALIIYLFVVPYLAIFHSRALGRLYADR
ncbi:MAG: DUF4013 domain-containing protein [Methanobacteriales archaeon]